MPLFSICIPNYNYAHYLGQTLESVLAQDCGDFEVIVADNASSDASVSIVEQFAGRDARVRLLRNRYNIGFAPNLQRATQEATGDFMLLLSSDDVMRPGALSAFKRVVDAFGDSARNTVYCTAAGVIDSEGRQVPDRRLALPAWPTIQAEQLDVDGLPVRVVDGKELLACSLRWMSNPLPFLSTLYPRPLYEAVEGYNSTWVCEPDFHFVLKLLSQHPRVACIDREYFSYRVHATNHAAREGQLSSLTVELDRYQLALQYSPQRAAADGVDHDAMLRTLIEDVCLKRAGRYLAAGQWRNAMRRFCLAWALYPHVAVKSPLTYGLLMLLMLGPLGGAVYRFAQGMRGSRPELPGA